MILMVFDEVGGRIYNIDAPEGCKLFHNSHKPFDGGTFPGVSGIEGGEFLPDYLAVPWEGKTHNLPVPLVPDIAERGR